LQGFGVSLKETQLTEPILERCFETYWPQFEEEFATILSTTPEAKIEERKGPDILNEVLETVRGLDKRVRTIKTNATKDVTPKAEDLRSLFTFPLETKEGKKRFLKINASGVKWVDDTDSDLTPNS
jgi:3-phenylpropionate/cinnamic acid dioxygenase small subunit